MHRLYTSLTHTYTHIHSHARTHIHTLTLQISQVGSFLPQKYNCIHFFYHTGLRFVESHHNNSFENCSSNIAGGVFNVGNPVLNCAIDVPVEMPSPVVQEGNIRNDNDNYYNNCSDRGLTKTKNR